MATSHAMSTSQTMLLTREASSARDYGWPIDNWPRCYWAWWDCILAVLLMLWSQGAVHAEVILGEYYGRTLVDFDFWFKEQGNQATPSTIVYNIGQSFGRRNGLRCPCQ